MITDQPSVSLIGEYEATIDTKGRFLLPAALKKQLPQGDNVFIVNRGFEKCVTLYPMVSWTPIVEKIKSLNEFEPKVREFRRYFLGGATEVELDAAGRLLLPPSLKAFAGLEKDIFIVANFTKIEIWDADRYRKFFDEFSSESFSRLAEEVMGNNGLNGFA